MRNSLIILCGLVLLLGCDTSDTVKPRNDRFFIKYFGLDGDQYASDLVATSDGGYVMVGTHDADKSRTQATGEAGLSGDEDVFVVKTDAEGNEEWKVSIDFMQSSQADLGSGVIETPGGYAIIGSTRNSTDYDMIMLNLGADGSLISEMRFGNDSIVSTNERGKSIGYINDGTNDYYYLVGETDNTWDKQSLDYYSIRLDMALNEDPLWASNKIVGIRSQSDYANNVFANPIDPRFPVMLGNIDDPQEDVNIVDQDTYSSWQVLALDGEYDDRYYGDNQSQEIADAAQLQSGGYVIVGTRSGANDVLYFSIANWQQETDGTWLLSRGVSGTPFSTIGNGLEGKSVVESQDGDFIFLGSLSYGTNKDIFLGRTNADGTAERWGRTFGADGINEGARVLETADGSIVFAGTMNVSGQRKICLIKTNAAGELK